MKYSQSQIIFWNRKEGREEVEEVYGDALLRWVYGTKLGQSFAEALLTRAPVSQLYGKFQSSNWSKRQIEPFIEKFRIPMDEFQEGPFQNFNEFFIRKFRDGARPFIQAPHEFPAFAEARYFAYDKVERNQKFIVKGFSLSPVGLLGSEENAQPFIGGPLLLARLCPTDYHRFHFPDNGKILRQYTLRGKLHSVNPFALQYKEDILITNERQISILETENFGKLAYIEVGALCVGKIVQSFNKKGPFQRGEEKGYFLFGGSTVIVMGEPGKFVPDQDLLEQTAKGRETLVRLGEKIGIRV